MEEYDFSIIHRPGTRHGNADAMSRRPLCIRPRCCPTTDRLNRPPTSIGEDGQYSDKGGYNTDQEKQGVKVAATFSNDLQSCQQPTTSAGLDRPASVLPDTALGAATSADFLSLDDIANEQITDADIGPIYLMLSTNSEKPDWDSIAPFSDGSKTLWRQWDRLSS